MTRFDGEGSLGPRKDDKPPASRDRPAGAVPTQPDLIGVAESLPCIVWIAAPDGFTEYFNRRGARYAGFPPEANYGWDWTTLVHPDDASHARSGWKDAVAAGTPYTSEYRIRGGDGRFRLHAFRSFPVRRRGGEIMKWMGIAVDIEDVVESEGLARQGSADVPGAHAARITRSDHPLSPEISGSEATNFAHVVEILEAMARGLGDLKGRPTDGPAEEDGPTLAP